MYNVRFCYHTIGIFGAADFQEDRTSVDCEKVFTLSKKAMAHMKKDLYSALHITAESGQSISFYPEILSDHEAGIIKYKISRSWNDSDGEKNIPIASYKKILKSWIEKMGE